jgi:glyoxylase-like metal-dependent hydrolase (beta-lactamase superfamily II)
MDSRYRIAGMTNNASTVLVKYFTGQNPPLRLDVCFKGSISIRLPDYPTKDFWTNMPPTIKPTNYQTNLPHFKNLWYLVLMKKTKDFESKHIRMHRLEKGIYAGIAKDGGWAISNAGLIDLGGRIIVFDTFMTPQAAADLKKFSIEQFGSPPEIVFNSHYHNDHIWGNQVFAGEAQIISSAKTRELIKTAGAEEYDWYSANAAHRLEALQEEFQSASQEKKKDLILWIGYYQGLVDSMPELSVHLPDATVKSQYTVFGTNYSVKLDTFEEAHTGSDSILFIPETGTLFMSDLLFVKAHPYLPDGNPEKLLEVVKEISQLDAETLVPGHGPVGTKADLLLMIEYIERCMETARALVTSGDTNEAFIQELNVPEKFKSWQLPHFYQANLQFLCKQIERE